MFSSWIYPNSPISCFCSSICSISCGTHSSFSGFARLIQFLRSVHRLPLQQWYVPVGCGRSESVVTYWTDINPGRRFWCCRQRCGFLRWFDPPMCARWIEIIPGLLRARNKDQETIATLRNQIRMLKIGLVCISLLGLFNNGTSDFGMFMIMYLDDRILPYSICVWGL